jgi:hypothetical protein
MECKCGQMMIWLVSSKNGDTAFWCECGISCVVFSDGKNNFEWHIPKGITELQLRIMTKEK